MGVASDNLPYPRRVRHVLVTLQFRLNAVTLDAFSHTAVSGAYLQYGSTRLFDSPSNLTLTVGARRSVFCLQPEATGPVPTSIEWYNPQGQVVSKHGGDVVNQVAGTGGGRVATLNFQSYQQGQGGKYECRVAGPGNNTQTLPICIGELWGDSSVSIQLSICQQISLGPSNVFKYLCS